MSLVIAMYGMPHTEHDAVALMKNPDAFDFVAPLLQPEADKPLDVGDELPHGYTVVEYGRFTRGSAARYMRRCGFVWDNTLFANALMYVGNEYLFTGDFVASYFGLTNLPPFVLLVAC